MAITTITRIENRGTKTVVLSDTENPQAKATVAPGTQLDVNMNIPWAASAGDFPQHHMELQVGGQTQFWIWQAYLVNNDFVRFSRDGAWHNPGVPVFGTPAVDGPRTLIVEDGCFQLVSYPDALIAAVQKVAPGPNYALCPSVTPDPLHPPPPPPASVPKLSVVAFSMAGIPSDAFKQGVPGARFMYRDSGKRYEFRVVNGVVYAYNPDGSSIALTNAVSFTHKRSGERTPQQITLPPIDLIAANGGRVFAKAKGQDAFYFATMDEMFIGADDQGREFVVPSSYFKLDPQFNQPGAQLADLMAPFSGCFADHPAAARFPFFRLLLEQNITDMMMVRLQPQVWYQLDLRPPMSGLVMQETMDVVALQILAQFQPLLSALQAAMPWTPFLSQLNSQLATWQAQVQLDEANLQSPTPTTIAPPSWAPTYPYVSYCQSGHTTTLTTVYYTKVLDIGVGHAHWHEQYESITGGELQPMRAGALFPSLLPQVNYAYLYRVVNGPVYDGDGYIDGTCNFYALVQLKDDGAIKNDSRYHPLPPPGSTSNTYAIGAGVPDSYAILYTDEQSYFTQRWRLVYWEDFRGLQTALVKGLSDDLTRQPRLYPDWRTETYWCPFRTGLIGSRSRMAVSRQVLVVNGEDGSGNAVLYSINFSYSSMDLTWRWRRLPPAAPAAYFDDDTAAGAEVIPPTGGNCVYPQTVRLREDMTIHMKGRGPGASNTPVVGRWYQRYLPASNALLPSANQLVANAPPPETPPHAWKFLPEAVFQAADRFSHFGVYDTVDSRTQYYTVTPATATDAAVLTSAGPGPWIDVGCKLYVRAWKFWWAAPLRPPDTCGPDLAGTADSLANYEGRPEKQPPSIFNPDTRLRIEQRSGQWVALHWDKRDDDLMPFNGLPMSVVLQNGAAQVTVTLQANPRIEGPPVVPLVGFVWNATPGAPVTLELQSPSPIWRIRMAALDASRPGGVVSLLNLEVMGYTLTPTVAGRTVYSWVPTAAQAADLQRYYSSAAAAEQYGTSIWFEDIVGHVSVPEEVHWLSPMSISVKPNPTPLRAPMQMLVSAVDAQSGAAVPGATVTLINYTNAAGTTVLFPANAPKAITLSSYQMPGPPGEPGDILEPTATVSAPGYGDADVPFVFGNPARMNLTVAPSPITEGVPVAVTIHTVDSKSGATVSGAAVKLNGQVVATTDVPFTYTFGSSSPAGVVTATGYPDAVISWPPMVPSSQVVWQNSAALLVGRNSDGRLEAFRIDAYQIIYHNWQTAPGGGWSGWNLLGPTAQAATSLMVGQNANGTLEVFALGTDTNIYHNWQTTNWIGWSQVPGGGQGKLLSVGRNADGRLELFVIGTDNQVYHNWQTAPSGSWSGWSLLGPGAQAATNLVVGQNADGRLEIFVIGTDTNIYHNWQTTPGGGWSGWNTIPGGGQGKLLSVGRNADGRLELFVIGTDNQVYHNWQTSPNSNAWSGWNALPMAPGSPVAALSPTTINFGSVYTGSTSQAHNVTVTNSGLAP